MRKREELEKSLLGSLLLGNDYYFSLNIKSEYFTGINKEIYETIAELCDKGEKADIVSVTQMKGKYATYIAELTDMMSIAPVVTLEKLVEEFKRDKLKQLDVISKQIQSGLDVDKKITEIEDLISFDLAGDQQIIPVNDVMKEVIDKIERAMASKKQLLGIPSGFSIIDIKLNGFSNSDMIIIGARPSVGKTAFALNCVANIAIENQIPVGFLSCEQPVNALVERLTAITSGIPLNNIRNGYVQHKIANLLEAGSKISKAPIFFYDKPNMSLADIRKQARIMKTRDNVKIIFIDYLGLITPNRYGEARHILMSEISRELKALARQLEIPIVVLSQVGRQADGQMPTLADLRETGSIEQDADVVIFLHRDKDCNNTEELCQISVSKNRNGATGDGEIKYISNLTKFVNL